MRDTDADAGLSRGYLVVRVAAAVRSALDLRYGGCYSSGRSSSGSGSSCGGCCDENDGVMGGDAVDALSLVRVIDCAGSGDKYHENSVLEPSTVAVTASSSSRSGDDKSVLPLPLLLDQGVGRLIENPINTLEKHGCEFCQNINGLCLDRL